MAGATTDVAVKAPEQRRSVTSVLSRSTKADECSSAQRSPWPVLPQPDVRSSDGYDGNGRVSQTSEPHANAAGESRPPYEAPEFIELAFDSEVDVHADCGPLWCPLPGFAELLSADARRSLLQKEHLTFLEGLSAVARAGMERIRSLN